MKSERRYRIHAAKVAGGLAVLLLLTPWLTGCQSMPRPAAGMAVLRVNVVAEPKAGSPAARQRLGVYDSGGSDYGGGGGSGSTASPGNGVNGGAFELVDYQNLDDIVICLEPADAAPATRPAALPEPHPIDLDPRKPSTWLHAASVGQRLAFHNQGGRSAVIYSVSDGNDFDLGPLPPGGRGEYAVRSAGLIEVLSDSAREPVAIVYAVPSRWVKVARAGRPVDFTDVPPGRYRLVSWHPRLPGYEQAVTLAADQSATATIQVGVNALPKVGAR